jgi:hypothetical protein
LDGAEDSSLICDRPANTAVPKSPMARRLFTVFCSSSVMPCSSPLSEGCSRTRNSIPSFSHASPGFVEVPKSVSRPPTPSMRDFPFAGVCRDRSSAGAAADSLSSDRSFSASASAAASFAIMSAMLVSDMSYGFGRVKTRLR